MTDRTKITEAATALRVGDRFDAAGKHRAAVVHRRGDAVLVRVTTRGARSATVRTYPADAAVTVWRTTETVV